MNLRKCLFIFLLTQVSLFNAFSQYSVYKYKKKNHSTEAGYLMANYQKKQDDITESVSYQGTDRLSFPTNTIDASASAYGNGGDGGDAGGDGADAGDGGYGEALGSGLGSGCSASFTSSVASRPACREMSPKRKPPPCWHRSSRPTARAASRVCPSSCGRWTTACSARSAAGCCCCSAPSDS